MEHVLDSGDLDNIRETRATLGHALIFLRISDEIRRCQEKLEQPLTEQQTNSLRGQIAGLRTARELPQIIETEAENNTKGKTHAA